MKAHGRRRSASLACGSRPLFSMDMDLVPLSDRPMASGCGSWLAVVHIPWLRTHIGSDERVLDLWCIRAGSQNSPLWVWQSQLWRRQRFGDKQRPRHADSDVLIEEASSVQGKIPTQNCEMECTSSSHLAHRCTLRKCEEYMYCGGLSMAGDEETINERQILDKSTENNFSRRS